ncbi:probable 39S ribosomal protein L45, mitochondrial isoform X2 [Nematostella vectensis]|uniref:probable 39S ribosomal protein L45, mitochondrial isoform X2 n=1 Tax=Nematostella vectensis TaxID=45351 RepID=UPI0020779A12|nr:probable 39S ribosomal protein L45, mitochondrial isoform X2 [Nematostella vectensis]
MAATCLLRRANTCAKFQIIARVGVDNSAGRNDLMLGPIWVLQSRTKISKSSPFGKRVNPMAAQRESFLKNFPNAKDMAPSKDNQESALVIDSVGTVVSNYVPLDKKAFILTPTGIKQRWNAFKMSLWTVYSLAFVRRYCKPFKLREFAKDAQNLFIQVNKALEDKNKRKLEELATGSVYHALRKEFFPPSKQLHWRYVKELERPRVVHARVIPVDSKENLFAQVTVKMNSEQVMAVKDQHGRHIKGSGKTVKKVTDYVVFERHLPNEFGRWRVAGKVFQPLQQSPAVAQSSGNMPSAQPSS